MKQILTIITLFIGLNTIAQIKFEKGYIINNNGEKIDCLIKNEDWHYNPKNFTYKTNNNSGEKEGDLANIKEFGIGDIIKYVRFNLKIDRSSTNINKLSTSRLYNYKEEVLFLKTLVEGNGNLYLFREGNFIKFFYKTKEIEIKQLEYKKYKNSKGNLAENNNYKTQLRINFSCKNLDSEKIKYRQKNLVNYFLNFNNCNNNSITTVKNFNIVKNKSKLNLGLKLGIENATITPKSLNFNTVKTKSTGNAFNIGLEVELVLPFNKNKWSIFTEPSYRSFSEDLTGNADGNIKYNSINIPIGVKHYLFLNNNSKLFLLGALALNFPIDSKITFDSNANLDISSGPSLMFGLGYTYKEKYSIETRYTTNKDLTDNYLYWETNYTSFALVLGYRIF